MHVAIDAVGIRGHGGAAVLIELLHWLPIVRPEWHWHVFLLERKFREFDDPPVYKNITLENTKLGNNGITRLWWVNHALPARVKNLNADILFSVANIGLSQPPTAQVVLCHQPNAFFIENVSTRSLFKRLRLRFMRQQILRGALASKTMIVQTEAMRERIELIEPRLKGRIHIIPSGYRTPSKKPNIRSEKKTLIDKASKPSLIYVTHPGESKNHLSLIQAMPKILEAFPNASLLLTLEKEIPSNSEYNFFVKKIFKQAAELGISKHLVWAGILNPDEVDYALRSSNLMIFPSLVESFGLGLVEAMAAGCPIAAADLPYAHDVCDNAALYFDPNDSESIMNTVITIFSNKEISEQLQFFGKKRKELFSYRKIAEEITLLLEQELQK